MEEILERLTVGEFVLPVTNTVWVDVQPELLSVTNKLYVPGAPADTVVVLADEVIVPFEVVQVYVIAGPESEYVPSKTTLVFVQDIDKGTPIVSLGYGLTIIGISNCFVQPLLDM